MPWGYVSLSENAYYSWLEIKTSLAMRWSVYTDSLVVLHAKP